MAPKREELKRDINSYLDKHFEALTEIERITHTGEFDSGDLLAFDPDENIDAVDGVRLLLSSIGRDVTLPSRTPAMRSGRGSIVFQYLAPANALNQAKNEAESAEKNNKKILLSYDRATDLKEDLRKSPWCDTAGFGLLAFIQRQLLSSINLTPFNGLNRFEISDKGLMIFQPFRAVSTRTVTYQDLVDRNVVLSINPPTYFDLMLGLLGQFRWGRDIPSPWGQLVVDEPGSGRIVGTTVVLWPAEKQKRIEELLKQLSDAESPPHTRMSEVPSLYSLLIGYDTVRWRSDLNEWRTNNGLIPEEYYKLLYIPPNDEKKPNKNSKSKWPKRLGCIFTIILFFGFIIIQPIRWLLRPIWGFLGRLIPNPLRLFSR